MSDMSAGFVYGFLVASGIGILGLWAALFVAVRERQPHDADDPD